MKTGADGSDSSEAIASAKRAFEWAQKQKDSGPAERGGDLFLAWAAAELYLIVVGSLVAFPAYIYALKHLPVATVSLYAYVNPVIAVLLGALLLGEPFGLRIVIASALVLLGVSVVRGWMGKRATARRAAAA